MFEKMKEADPWVRSPENTRASEGGGLRKAEKRRPALGFVHPEGKARCLNCIHNSIIKMYFEKLFDVAVIKRRLD